MSKKTCQVEQIINAQSGTDGAGVKLFQVNVSDKSLIDPFVHLDEIAIENHQGQMPGFPAHPHRGSQFLTYLKHGEMHHKDSLGGSGKLESGDIQYLNAGCGVLHSEMPQPVDGKLSIFQIWINLAVTDKAAAPSYCDVKRADLPVITLNDANLKLLAGSISLSSGQKLIQGGVQEPNTEFSVLDCSFEQQGELALTTKPEHIVLVYVYQGRVAIGEQSVTAQQLAVLNAGDLVKLYGKTNSQCLILSGKPLKEPVVCSGPFVMADQAGIEQAYHDLKAGKYGHII